MIFCFRLTNSIRMMHRLYGFVTHAFCTMRPSETAQWFRRLMAFTAAYWCKPNAKKRVHTVHPPAWVRQPIFAKTSVCLLGSKRPSESLMAFRRPCLSDLRNQPCFKLFMSITKRYFTSLLSIRS